MKKNELLRSLPSVDELLKLDEIVQLQSRCARTTVVGWIREAISEQRNHILAAANLTDQQSDAQANTCREIVERVLAEADVDQGQSVQAVINATGILLHTNLGRAPLAQRAIDRVRQAAGFTNVELNLSSGRRDKRGRRVMDLLSRLTGADDALVVNNCAAATMLVLRGIAFGKEVVISRGQLVEIGGGFRLPNVFESAGVVLREVGTTNRTYVRDYESVISENTGAILRVHHSNFRLTGFVTEPSIDDLLACQRPPGLPVIDDVGSGCVCDLSEYGFAEPDVRQSVAAGADLVLFSGDKLFGGPQAGIIVGKQDWIDRLRKDPMMRAIRVDKMTLAALEATTEIHLEEKTWSDIPLYKMLSRSLEDLRSMADEVRNQLTGPGADAGFQVDVVASQSQIGGGSVPGVEVPSVAVVLKGHDLDAVAQRLRTGQTSVQARLSQDAIWLDMRSVADNEVIALSQSVVAALAPVQ